MADGISAAYSSLGPLLADLKAAGDRIPRRDVMRGLRAGGNLVRTQARINIAAELKQHSHDLYGSVRVNVTGKSAVSITANATHRGFRYGLVFEKRGTGPDAFLYPALLMKRDEAVAAIAKSVGEALDAHHL